MTDKYTRKQFQAQYSNDDACLRAILIRRYGKSDVCPDCGLVGELKRLEGRRAFFCEAWCHIYPCAGTVFEHSSTPLTDWFYAMYLMTATRNGVSAKELQRQLGVTYKCAWRIGHQLRDLMAARDKANNPGQLSGHVEIDATFVGGKIRRSQGTRKSNKACVVGAVERGGSIKAKVGKAENNELVMPFVHANIAPGSVVNSDTWNVYRKLPKLGYKLVMLNHQKEQWSDGIHNTNTIEGFWSHLKRGIKSTHASVSPKHLQGYVDEFAFRYNNRQAPAEMFKRMLAQISKPISS